MPKKLPFKPCPFCNTPIMGIKRLDRNAYRYARRCPDCAGKALTDVAKAAKCRVLERIRVKVPLGSKRLHKTRNGFTYVLIKIAEPSTWAYEHRVVTNAPKGFHVHHINRDTKDNRAENLVVISPQKHRVAHTLTQWARKFMCCVKCQSTEKRHLSHGLCTTCYQQEYPPKK